jgi:hypothetical protein
MAGMIYLSALPRPFSGHPHVQFPDTFALPDDPNIERDDVRVETRRSSDQAARSSHRTRRSEYRHRTMFVSGFRSFTSTISMSMSRRDDPRIEKSTEGVRIPVTRVDELDPNIESDDLKIEG